MYQTFFSRTFWLNLFLCSTVLAWTLCGCDDSDDGDDSTDTSSKSIDSVADKDKDSEDAADIHQENAKDQPDADNGGSTEEQTIAACQCLFDIGSLPDSSLIQVCSDNIIEECITCLNETAADEPCEGKSEEKFSKCTPLCQTVIPPPETAEGCKELVAFDTSNPSSPEVIDCMCEKCLDTFAPCMVNPYCLDIMVCATVNQCSGTACLEPCGDEINASPSDSPALTLVMSVDSCSTENNCQGSESDGSDGSDGSDESDGSE